MKKSAKDIAFDKERAKYNKKIRELELQLKEKDNTISCQNDTISKLSEEVLQLKDWVDRLLEYTELSEEEMKDIIDTDKKSAEIIDKVSTLYNFFGAFK